MSKGYKLILNDAAGPPTSEPDALGSAAIDINGVIYKPRGSEGPQLRTFEWVEVGQLVAGGGVDDPLIIGAVEADEITVGGADVATVLADPGNTWPPNTAVAAGFRFSEDILGAVRVFETVAGGSTHETVTDFGDDFIGNDYAKLGPLSTIVEGTVTWRYLGIVGELPWTAIPTPIKALRDGNGNLFVVSQSTPDDGDVVFSLHPTGLTGNAALLEVASDGQADYIFPDDLMGETFLDFQSAQAGAIVIRLGSATFEVRAHNTAGLFAIKMDEGKISFFGAAPVVRPEVPASPNAQDIVDALKLLGLVSQAV